MRKKLANNKICLLLLLLCIMPLLNGCGRDAELENFKSEMERFYSDITAYDEIINSINVESENAVQELLAALDSLEECFTRMAALSIPEEFSAIEALAREAGEYMSKAVTLYHQAYKSDPFDAATAEAAKDYYDRANKRAVYILNILHGEIPEGIELEEP